MEIDFIEEENKFKKFGIVRIPKTSITTTEDTLVVGIIDASGSMSSCWKEVVKGWNYIIDNVSNIMTITFDFNQKVTNGKLTDNLSDWGGTTTLIIEAFMRMEKEISIQKELIKSDKLTIVFISDGMDTTGKLVESKINLLNKLNQFKLVNFICIGIGSGFPTSLSMDLRAHYHNGSSEIPPLYLVENTSDHAEIYAKVASLMEKRELIKVNPYVIINPWEEVKESAFENSFVLSDVNSFKINGQEYELKFSENHEDYEKIFSYWLQNLQLLSIKKTDGKLTFSTEEIKKFAGVTYQAMEALSTNFENKVLNKLKNTSGKSSFYDRVLISKMQKDYSNMYSLMKEVKLMSQDTVLSKLSEQDLAKRLAIGTKLGKYYDKALKMRGYSVDQFEKDKKDFIELFKKYPITKSEFQEVSFILLQNQKDILLEENFLEGLNLCNTQYDLVDSLPLVGLALKVYRSDGSMINPWNICVTGVARLHNTIDTVSLIKEKNEMKIPIGNNEFEKINCVLPLFSEKDKDLKEFLNSNLFHLLMTFNVMSNIDMLYNNAYFALLANTTYFILKQEEESLWKQEILNKLRMNSNLIRIQDYSMYMEALIRTPRLAMVTEHTSLNYKCDDLSKPVFFLFELINNNNCKFKDEFANDAEKIIDSIFEAMLIEFFGRSFSKEQINLESLFEIKNKEDFDKLDFSEDTEEILKKYMDKKTILNFYSINDLKNAVLKDFLNSKKNINVNIEIQKNKHIFEQIFNNKHSLKGFQSIYKNLTKSINSSKNMENIFNDNNYLKFINHALSHSNSFDRNTSDVFDDVQSIESRLKLQLANIYIEKNRKGIINKAMDKIIEFFIFESEIAHINVFPINSKEIESYLSNVLKIDNKEEISKMLGQYKFTMTGLLRNACCSIDCPHFLKINSSFSNHLAVTNAYPGYHLIICSNKSLSSEEIYKKLISVNTGFSSLKVKEAINDMIKNKDLHIKVIERCKEIYKFN